MHYYYRCYASKHLCKGQQKFTGTELKQSIADLTFNIAERLCEKVLALFPTASASTPNSWCYSPEETCAVNAAAH